MGAKVKDAFKHLGEKIKSKSEDLWKKIVPVAGPVIEKYKDLIVKSLQHQGKVVINEGKKIVITVINDVVKVVIDGIEAVSKKIEFEDELESANSKIGDKFKEIWAKVVAAWEKLKVKELFKKYGEKVVAALEAVLNKYKDIIVEALKADGITILNEGRKIAIELVKDAAQIIIDGMHALGGKNEIAEESNGFKEIWGKVVEAIKGVTGPLKKDVEALITKYKPRIVEELQKFKKVVIEEGKGLVVEMLGDAIKIIIKGGIGYEAVEENSFADMWEKVKAKVAKMKEVVREITMKKLDKYKPQIMDAVQHLKDVVIACGKDVVITVKDGIIKVIVDGGVVEEKPDYIY